MASDGEESLLKIVEDDQVEFTYRISVENIVKDDIDEFSFNDVEKNLFVKITKTESEENQLTMTIYNRDTSVQVIIFI